MNRYIHHMSNIRVPVWTLGNRIRKVREDAGLTQEQLATELEYSRAAIASWEADGAKPRKAVLREIARITQTPEWFVFGDENSTVTRTVTAGQRHSYLALVPSLPDEDTIPSPYVAQPYKAA